MKKTLVIALLSAGLFACNENRIYSDHQELSPQVEWKKADTREFEVPVEDNSQAYNFGLSFRFAHGYQFKVAKIKVTETSPSGKEEVNEYELKIRDDKGEYIGEAGYDIWDSEHVIVPNKKFSETGVYKYKLEHVMPQDPLNFAMEIGVILDKAL
ncbi:MAG: hypothetical protein HRT72_09050 [Flavobacteriales bacterium]|nr:hypothetical protein [Flavobacteriales bacterium]